MISIIEKLPMYFQMAIIAVIVVIGSYVILKLSQLFVTGIKISIGKIFSIDTSQDKKNRDKDRENNSKNPHYGCTNWGNFYSMLVELTDDMYNKAVIQMNVNTLKAKLEAEEIQEPYLLKAQMDYAEMKGTKIIGICQKAFLEELERKNAGKVVRSYSYAIYLLILNGVIRRQVEIVFRDFFKQVKLLRCSDSDYKILRDEKVDCILQMITDSLNKEYFFHEDITQEELYVLNLRHKDRIADELEDIIDEARKLIQTWQLKNEQKLFESMKKLTEINDKMMNLVTTGNYDQKVE